MSAATLALFIVVLACAATMPVYALEARSQVDAEVARRPTTILLGQWVRSWVMWLIGPLERMFIRWKVSPDAFNYAGALLGAAAGVAYAFNQVGLGAVLVLTCGLADILDGRVARAQGLASNYGEFLDSTLDRFAETFAYVGIAVLLTGSRIGVLAAGLALGGSMLVSYVRARGQGLGVDYRGGTMQRAERLVLLVVGSIVQDVWRPSYDNGALIATLGLIGVASVMTAWHRTRVVASRLRA